MLEKEYSIFDARISVPFGMVIAGPTRSGKSSFVYNILLNMNRILSHTIDYIVYFYGERSRIVEAIENTFGDRVHTVHGLPTDLNSYIKTDEGRGLMIFDDLMVSAVSNEQLVNLTTTKCQHNNVSWMLILQNLFFGGTERITMLRSAHYLCLFKSPLDKTIAHSMASRIMPDDRKTFMAIYERVTEQGNGYLFVDGSQHTPKAARLRSRIFDEFQLAYVPKSGKKHL